MSVIHGLGGQLPNPFTSKSSLSSSGDTSALQVSPSSNDNQDKNEIRTSDTSKKGPAFVPDQIKFQDTGIVRKGEQIQGAEKILPGVDHELIAAARNTWQKQQAGDFQSFLQRLSTVKPEMAKFVLECMASGKISFLTLLNSAVHNGERLDSFLNKLEAAIQNVAVKPDDVTSMMVNLSMVRRGLVESVLEILGRCNAKDAQGIMEFFMMYNASDDEQMESIVIELKSLDSDKIDSLLTDLIVKGQEDIDQAVEKLDQLDAELIDFSGSKDLQYQATLEKNISKLAEALKKHGIFMELKWENNDKNTRGNVTLQELDEYAVSIGHMRDILRCKKINNMHKIAIDKLDKQLEHVDTEIENVRCQISGFMKSIEELNIHNYDHDNELIKQAYGLKEDLESRIDELICDRALIERFCTYVNDQRKKIIEVSARGQDHQEQMKALKINYDSLSSLMEQYHISNGNIDSDLQQLDNVLEEENLKALFRDMIGLESDMSVLLSKKKELDELKAKIEQARKDAETWERISKTGAERKEDLQPADRAEYERLMKDYAVRDSGDHTADLKELHVRIFGTLARDTDKAIKAEQEIQERVKRIVESPSASPELKEQAGIIGYESRGEVDKIKKDFLKGGLALGYSLDQLQDFLHDMGNGTFDPEKDYIPQGGTATRTPAFGVTGLTNAMPGGPASPYSVAEEAHDTIYRLFTRFGMNTPSSSLAIEQGQPESETAEEVLRTADAQKQRQLKALEEKATRWYEERKEALEEAVQQEAEQRLRDNGILPERLMEHIHGLTVAAHYNIQKEIKRERRLGTERKIG